MYVQSCVLCVDDIAQVSVMCCLLSLADSVFSDTAAIVSRATSESWNMTTASGVRRLLKRVNNDDRERVL